MPCKWRDIEETAANMPDFERVSVAAYGRIIASFKDGPGLTWKRPRDAGLLHRPACVR
jgi:hypothetical protein